METSLRTAARNNVDALIRESKMISDIVTSITEYIGQYLKEKLRTAPWTVKPGKGSISKKEGEFEYNNIGISFKVKCVWKTMKSKKGTMFRFSNAQRMLTTKYHYWKLWLLRLTESIV